MAELKITIQVPNGDTCNGCNYLDFSSYEYAYQQYDEYWKCKIFDCKLKGKTKCISCRTLTRIGGNDG